jgi:hypothetical protein
VPFTVKDNSRIRLTNNIFWSKINTRHPGRPKFDHNCFFGPQTVKDAAKLVVEPLLLNVCPPKDGMEHADNYRLQAESPCRDAGLAITDNGGQDFWKNALYNAKPDIGAHEYGAGRSQVRGRRATPPGSKADNVT